MVAGAARRRPRHDGRADGEPGGSRRADAVYFTACVGTMFGPSEAGPGVRESFEQICDRAGITLAYPADLPDLCCGTPWRSKGMKAGYAAMAGRVLPASVAASRAGRAAGGLRRLVVHRGAAADAGERDSPPRTAATPHCGSSTRSPSSREHVLPRLALTRKLAVAGAAPDLLVHPDGTERLAARRWPRAVAESVTVPDTWGCCGFAGDRGLLHPELTASATHAQAAELADGTFDAFASCNRTCELGMTRATGEQYQHVLELVDWASSSS